MSTRRSATSCYDSLRDDSVTHGNNLFGACGTEQYSIEHERDYVANAQERVENIMCDGGGGKRREKQRTK